MTTQDLIDKAAIIEHIAQHDPEPGRACQYIRRMENIREYAAELISMLRDTPHFDTEDAR